MGVRDLADGFELGFGQRPKHFVSAHFGFGGDFLNFKFAFFFQDGHPILECALPSKDQVHGCGKHVLLLNRRLTRWACFQLRTCTFMICLPTLEC